MLKSCIAVSTGGEDTDFPQAVAPHMLPPALPPVPALKQTFKACKPEQL